MTTPVPFGPPPRPAGSVRIRSEADVLALVPHALGFHPEESLVLTALPPDGRAFHARVDLPERPDDLPLVVETLVEPAARHDARQALVVAYSDDACLAQVAAGCLVGRLAEAGVRTVLAIRADGQRWFPLGPGPDDPRAADGVPYDVSTHVLTTQAVLEGRVTYRSREDLADSLVPHDPEVVEGVAAHAATLPGLRDASEPVLRAEGAWLVAQVRAFLEREVVPGPLGVARMLHAVAHPDVRDLAWNEMRRVDADRHVRLWRTVVVMSPQDLVAPAAALLGFAAWLSGHGALAWCAVERSLEADPDHSLARLVGDALEAAMPPSRWTPVPASSLRLSR